MRLLSRLILSLLALAGGPACSYALVRGPSPVVEQSSRVRGVEQRGLECTSSNAAPVLDTVIASPLLGAGVVSVVAGVGGAVSHQCSSDCLAGGPTPGMVIGLGLALTALGTLALSSAVTGYGRTADCRAQQAVSALPHQGDRYLLDLDGIADARGRKAQERP